MVRYSEGLDVGACDMDDIASLCNEVNLVCGNLALGMDKMSLALDLANRVLERSPRDKTALMLLAKMHVLRNEYDQVIELLRAVDKDGKLWEVYALACYKLARFDSAMAAIAHCADDEERDEDSRFGLQHLECRILLLADPEVYPLEVTVKRFEQTLKLTQQSKKPSNHLEALFTRAQLFEKNCQWEECSNDLQDSIEILQSPEAVNHFHVKDFLFKVTFAYLYKVFLTWKVHADSKLVDQLFQKSLKFTHTATTLQPLHLSQYVYRMLTHQNVDLEGLKRHVSSYSDGLKPLAYYIIARALLDVDTPESDEKACEYLQKSLALNKVKPHVWISMGSLYLKTKKVPDALSAYSRAIELTEIDGSSHDCISKQLLPGLSENFKSFSYFGTAQAYLMSNDAEGALAALRKCLDSLSGDDKDAMDKKGLEDLISVVTKSKSVDLQKLKESLTIPEIPLSLFLNPMFYLKESQVFQIKSAVLDDLLTTLKVIPYVDPNINNSNFKQANKLKKKVLKKTNDTTKPTKTRKRKRDDIFRRANLSIPKKPHASNVHKKRQSYTSDYDKHNTTLTNHTPSHDHAQPQNHDPSTHINENNTNPFYQSPTTTNSTTSIKHINIPSIPSSSIYEPTFLQHQQQYGTVYPHNEHNRPSQGLPFNHTNMSSSNPTSIYPHPASVIHYYQPVDFSASQSFYYPQQSIEEAYRDNSNGIDSHSPPPNYGQPLLIPQYSNPVYLSDRPRYQASLPTSFTPFMTPQQLQHHQHPSLLVERTNFGAASGKPSADYNI